jgi:hypothetical protein
MLPLALSSLKFVSRQRTLTFSNFIALITGDLKSKLNKMKNHIGNSIGNHQDNRLDTEYIRNRFDEDSIR